jgi:hypothetical protein
MALSTSTATPDSVAAAALRAVSASTGVPSCSRTGSPVPIRVRVRRGDHRGRQRRPGEIRLALLPHDHHGRHDGEQHTPKPGTATAPAAAQPPLRQPCRTPLTRVNAHDPHEVQDLGDQIRYPVRDTRHRRTGTAPDYDATRVRLRPTSAPFGLDPLVTANPGPPAVLQDGKTGRFPVLGTAGGLAGRTHPARRGPGGRDGPPASRRSPGTCGCGRAGGSRTVWELDYLLRN